MRIVALALGLFLGLAPAAAQDQVASPPSASDPAAVAIKTETKRWEFGVLITAVGGPCGGLSGTIPVPRDWPEQQVKIVAEDISPSVRGYTFREQEGLRQLLFEVPQLAAGEKANCLITLEVSRTTQLPPADPAALVIPKATHKEARKYLGNSPLIETTNAKFKALAKELTTGKETAWAQVEAIYDGVRERVKFQSDNKATYKGALGALRDGNADKEDLTAVFVATCRAHKVPARLVWVFDGCDAEFFLDDGSGKGQWFPCELYGDKQFGTVAHLRPIIEKGDNFRVPERKEPLRFVPETLTGKAEKQKGNAGRPQVEFRRRMVATP